MKIRGRKRPAKKTLRKSAEIRSTPAILLIGLHSSGKSTLSQTLASTGPYWIFELGDGVREEARRRKESNLVRIASEILSGKDPVLLARIAAKRARAMPEKIPIFVGARTLLEYEFLASMYPLLIVIGISTPDAIRRERWRGRQMLASDKWIERERWEARWQTRTLVHKADIRLDGTAAIPSMCKKISEKLEKTWKKNYDKP